MSVLSAVRLKEYGYDFARVRDREAISYRLNDCFISNDDGQALEFRGFTDGGDSILVRPYRTDESERISWDDAGDLIVGIPPHGWINMPTAGRAKFFTLSFRTSYRFGYQPGRDTHSFDSNLLNVIFNQQHFSFEEAIHQTRDGGWQKAAISNDYALGMRGNGLRIYRHRLDVGSVHKDNIIRVKESNDFVYYDMQDTAEVRVE